MAKQHDLFPNDTPPKRASTNVLYRQAYERGIRRAASDPFVMVGTRVGSTLGAVAREHAIVNGVLLTGEALLVWIEQNAFDFRTATANEPQYWSGWQPFAFVRWINMRVARSTASPINPNLQPLAPRRT